MEMPYKFDLSDVKGQLRPRRALEIAAAGAIPCSLKDHPGTGKTSLALTPAFHFTATFYQETLKLRIYSISNTPHTFGQRPFSRAPPYSISNCTGWGGCQFQQINQSLHK